MSTAYEPFSVERIRDIIALGLQMHAESAYSDMPFDIETAAQSIYTNIIQGDAGFGVIAYKDDKPVGMMAGALATQFFGPAVFAYDFVWYVVPEDRGSRTAIRMLKKFESWARSKGAKEIHLGVTTGVDPDKTHGIYERMGYKHVGNNYTLKI